MLHVGSRAPVSRATCAFQALRAPVEDPPPEQAATVPGEVIRVTADARMLSLALQACVGMLVSLVEASTAAASIQIAARVSEGIAWCEMRQDAYRLSADQFSRFADLEWSERSGGIPSGIGLAAAARIAQVHGGALDAWRSDAGGCVLILTIRA